MEDAKRLRLIVEAIRYCKHVREMGMPAACYTKALREPVHFLWERRAGPKVKVAKFRSKNAVNLKFGDGRLVYDHAVPFKYLQAELLALSEVTEAAVKRVLERFGTIVLTTKKENSFLNKKKYAHKMPEEWDGIDPLARYRAAGIELIENSSA